MLILLAATFTVLLGVFIVGLLTMYLWNVLITVLFDKPRINILQAIGLQLFVMTFVFPIIYLAGL